MKVVIEIDPTKSEEIVVRAAEPSEKLFRLQKAIESALAGQSEVAVRSGEGECFLSPEEIVFAETSGGRVWIHTASEIYFWPYTLRELEELDFGSSFNSHFSGLHVLKFEEILHRLACHTIMNINIKPLPVP